MWVKLKHQPVKEGALLAKNVSKEDLYRKELMSVFIVHLTDDGKYDLQTFMLQPDMIGLMDGVSPMLLPIDIPMTYEELAKEHWYLWIE